MNLPNLLTLTRIFLIPLLIVALLYGHKNLTATFIFSFAAVTDWLDGLIARKRNQVTDFGKLFDPIADKLLISAALISLVGLQRVPAWIAVILISREFAVTGLRGIIAKEGHIIAAEKLGKLKLVVQIIGIIIIMSNITWMNSVILAAANYSIPLQPGLITLEIATILSVISGVQYFRAHWNKIHTNS
ncbi:MAG: CDP-diacylglycerol--glycerol-3-phosphate 3-phosphatidyltransferase [Candidatus Schekmanbacteria bacterium RBG_13_48_7]|uniref:CDP-diacylglycerol--glycerol-3-phosphate 3-phosphatidyltransferase n=1 Tax=Candidatus Schekmanbacteria bacterium RBG_13_48_7 TaxID=1817878 RepID=A0A1F7RNM0_9BACT|nr:MAG: CDP-diacylglycerol--glycerol-3-phosphate 3-phosphatidyltransferase [Candidatus Schekmanbacteria bacterium RBG_13_48_7]